MAKPLPNEVEKIVTEQNQINDGDDFGTSSGQALDIDKAYEEMIGNPPSNKTLAEEVEDDELALIKGGSDGEEEQEEEKEDDDFMEDKEE